jgi:hypothetical protein
MVDCKKRYIYELGFMDVFFYLAAILEKNIFPFLLSPVILLDDVLPNRQCASNFTLPFIMHHYIGVTNCLTPIKLVFQTEKKPRNLLIGCKF